MNRRFLFTSLFWIGFLVLMGLSLLSIPQPVHGQDQITPTIAISEPTIDPQKILEEAQKTQESAAQAMEAVNSILGLIESLGAYGGILFALVAVLFSITGLRTLWEYRRTLNEARSELDQMRQQLQGETTRANIVLKESEHRVTQGMVEFRGQIDNAIRALALLQLGEQQMEARNMNAALNTFLEAYKYDPNNRATNYFLGELYIQQRELKTGIEHLERTRGEDNVFYPPAEAAMGYALRVLGDRHSDPNERNHYYARAERHFLEALKNDPTVRDINGESFHGVLGGLYRRQGRIPDAIRAYQAAEKVTPQNSYPINNLAMLHFMQGEREEAHSYFKRSLALSEREIDGNPYDYWARFNIVTAHAALEQTQQALDSLVIAVEQSPGSGPLEGLLDGLLNLKTSPHPPTEIDRVVAVVQQTIEKKKKPEHE